jgi:hypothetical protein
MSNVKIRHISIALFAGYILLLSGLAPKPLRAQVSGATILGTITDASGAAVSGAGVDITDVSTDVTQSLTTDVAGFFSAPNLRLGKYDVTITAPGFATYIEHGVTLTVAAQQELNITLKIGGKTDKIEVSSTAAVVELASSAISAVVNSTTVRELPLNGRSWTDLASLQPGVSGLKRKMLSIQAQPGAIEALEHRSRFQVPVRNKITIGLMGQVSTIMRMAVPEA